MSELSGGGRLISNLQPPTDRELLAGYAANRSNNGREGYWYQDEKDFPDAMKQQLDRLRASK